MSLPAVEDITVASRAITKMAARITANLTRPQPITISLTPPPITTNRTTLLTQPRRMLGNPTVGAESLMAVAENTTSH